MSDDLKAQDAVRELLKYIGENPEREGLLETPKRFVKAFKELNVGYGEDPRKHLNKTFVLDDHELEMAQYDQMILSKDLPFSSLCEHHLLPFEGVAHIAYIPNKEGRVVGLSKLARTLEGYARRLQVQERLTQQIASSIQEVLKPAGVAVMIEAHHTCQCLRGIKKEGKMVTSAVYGLFRSDPKTRTEFFQCLR